MSGDRQTSAVRTINDEEVKTFKRRIFSSMKREKEDLLMQFDTVEKRILALETQTVGGQTIAPDFSLRYTASLIRLALGYTKARGIHFNRAQEDVANTIGGPEAYEKRKITALIESANHRAGGSQ